MRRELDQIDLIHLLMGIGPRGSGLEGDLGFTRVVGGVLEWNPEGLRKVPNQDLWKIYKEIRSRRTSGFS